MNQKEEKLRFFNGLCKNTLMETLKIKYVDLGEDYIVATMPVNERVYQPDGILNGGATLALAESVGSPTSMLVIDNNKFSIRGVQMSANHIRSVKSGFITATTKFIHKGRTTHIIEISIKDNQGNLVSLCTLTSIILPKK
jgi:uncharacterized protein (TIGR00369 family)